MGSYDVTDKSTTNVISRTTYEGASYTHQGWVTNTTVRFPCCPSLPICSLHTNTPSSGKSSLSLMTNTTSMTALAPALMVMPLPTSGEFLYTLAACCSARC